ncbi:MAG: protein kinase [Planctomycetaceae bacterium]|nr:protein kinase [Planctomycetaceae bacterium]
MRLVDKQQARECLRDLNSGHQTGANFLQVLLDQHVLTPFQVESIKKMDTGILVLGNNKLLYANAAGSFARVYRAENLEDGRAVGVKVLRHRWTNDPDTVSLFQAEAKMGQKLKHPNIVPIFDIGHEGGNHFFTMDFIQGGNLRDFIQIRKQVEPHETIKYAIDMARGLE